jgi:RNA polymerase sigma-70 factor (ECF subfamily)
MRVEADSQEPALAKDGPRRRFELLALPHLDAAYNLACWLTGSATDAEDVVQEAYLRAYRFFDTFRGDNIRVWPLTIVRNSFHTWVKENRSPRLGFVAELPEPDNAEDERILWSSPQADPETLLLRDIDHAKVGQLVLRLPSAYREILLLREVEELSYREIADITGTPVGTVMSRMSRAREALLLPSLLGEPRGPLGLMAVRLAAGAPICLLGQAWCLARLGLLKQLAPLIRGRRPVDMLDAELR